MGDSEDDLVNVLCYLGKPKKYVEEHADFLENKEAFSEYGYEYDSYDFPYVELNFDNDSILYRVSFYGDSSYFDEISVGNLLNREYDTVDYYSGYTWHTTKLASLFTEVNFDNSGYISVYLNEDDYKDCEYELSFCKY